MEPVRRLATYEDLRALPEEVRAEIIDGTVVTSPSPLPEHGRVQRSVGRYIGGPFDDDDGHGGPGGWWVIPEVDVRFSPHDVTRPDLSGWRRERLPNPWGMRPIDVVPDWICEVLSPSNERHDRVHKASIYRQGGVSYLWLVQPIERVLEAFKLENEQWVRLCAWTENDVARIPPFDAIKLDLARIFPPPISE